MLIFRAFNNRICKSQYRQRSHSQPRRPGGQSDSAGLALAASLHSPRPLQPAPAPGSRSSRPSPGQNDRGQLAPGHHQAESQKTHKICAQCQGQVNRELSGFMKHCLFLEMIPQKVCSGIINVGKSKFLTQTEILEWISKKFGKLSSFSIFSDEYFPNFFHRLRNEIYFLDRESCLLIKLETLPCCRNLLVDSSTLNFF